MLDLRSDVATGRLADGAGAFTAVLAGQADELLHSFVRPVLNERSGAFELPEALAWRARLDAVRTRVEAAAASVGRLSADRSVDQTRLTAWMITPDLAVTTRRAALGFAGWSARGARLRAALDGSAGSPRIVFGSDRFDADSVEATVLEVAYLAELSELAPDVALLRLQAVGPRPLPPPVALAADALLTGQYVAVVSARQATPDGLLGVARTLRPGQIVSLGADDLVGHDCDVPGDQTGGVLLDLSTGAAAGLHLGVDEQGVGYAVAVAGLRQAVQRAGRHHRVVVHEPAVPSAEREAAGLPAADRIDLTDLADRDGYRTDFLGKGALAVPLPILARGLSAKTLVPPGGDQRRGVERFLVRYRHFSLAMHAERRLAIFTAVNIDGEQALRVKRRSDSWAYDPRLPRAAQLGPDLYADNDLDRGHLTRRLDPAWGVDTVAAEAERDTFYFTNAAPQQSRFNQHLWSGLEDYLLDHADTLDFRASVFTGPVFSSADRPYRGALLPLAYWKVAVMANAETGALLATGYLVSQADLLPTADFVYGEYRTYQLPLARVEELTGLAFPKLRPFDPLGTTDGAPPRQLVGHGDIVLTPRKRVSALR